MLKEKIRSQPIVLALSVLVLVIITISSFSFIIVDSPSLCGLCHQEYSTWKTSAHKKASCTDCHKPPGRSGWIVFKVKKYQMLVSYILNNYKQPIAAEVDNKNCLLCHQDIQKKTLTRRTIRVSHKEFLRQGSYCTECHNTTTHQNQVPRKKYPHMEKCTGCHNGDTAPKDCNFCHTKQKSRKPRYSMGPWAVTHGDKWAKTHGMGDLSTCSLCHSQDYCYSCHKTELPHREEVWQAQHGKAAIYPEQGRRIGAFDVCYSCHLKSYCSSCHQIEMPHPKDFLPKHGQMSKKMGEKSCLRCHIKYDCDDCHTRHIHRAVKHGKS